MTTTVPSLVPILTAARMKACDAHTIRDLGIPSRTLMERAAAAVVSALVRNPDRLPGQTVTILCGRGNNGGDGFAVGRLLAAGEGNTPALTRLPRILYVGPWTADEHQAPIPDKASMSSACAEQYELAAAAGVPILPPACLDDMASFAAAGCIVDALFGIGLDRPLDAATIALLDRLRATGQPVLAVDIPSGIHADTGAVLGTALSAAVTVTMQALKPGLLLYPGAELVGCIEVADIGVSLDDPRPYDAADTADHSPHPNGCLADEALLRAVLPPRRRRTHKGTYGQALLLCGSTGMSGAATLSARAALRAGAGLCRVLTTDDNRVVLQITVPEAIVTTYGTTTPDVTTLRAAVATADALVAGCGLGTSAASATALRAVLNACPADGSVPVVLDADALNLLAADPTLWDTTALTAPARRVVITPHPAEMSRLTAKPIAAILADPLAAARELAAARGVTVLLKDAHTVIAAPDGYLLVCRAGNAGMATGGSGDVLAGVLGALLGQRRADRTPTNPPSTAGAAPTASVAAIAAAAAYLHAAAGDIAAATLGEYALVAGDIVNALPAVTASFSTTTSPPCTRR